MQTVTYGQGQENEPEVLISSVRLDHKQWDRHDTSATLGYRREQTSSGAQPRHRGPR
jgi:hypothetical protein